MAEHQRKASPPPRLPGARFLVVEARYYDGIGELLLAGARAAFEAAGASFHLISARSPPPRPSRSTPRRKRARPTRVSSPWAA